MLPLIIIHLAKTCKSSANAKHDVSNIKQAVEIMDLNTYALNQRNISNINDLSGG